MSYNHQHYNHLHYRQHPGVGSGHPCSNSPWLPMAGRRKSTTLSRTSGHYLAWRLPASPNPFSLHSSHSSRLGCPPVPQTPSTPWCRRPFARAIPPACSVLPPPCSTPVLSAPRRLCLTSNITSEKSSRTPRPLSMWEPLSPQICTSPGALPMVPTGLNCGIM